MTSISEEIENRNIIKVDKIEKFRAINIAKEWDKLLFELAINKPEINP